jgi:hypothetical protein
MNPNPIDPLSQGAASQLGRVDSGATQGKPRVAQGREAGPAFEALLEKLERHAEELRRDSASVDDPERLSGAVDRARESLQDALGLGDRLLEAYRQAAHQKHAATSGENHNSEPTREQDR